MKLSSIFVIFFIAKISAEPLKIPLGTSSVENFSAYIDQVSEFSSVVRVSNVITSASQVVKPATASLVAAHDTGVYKIVSNTFDEVNQALNSGSAMTVFQQIFKTLIKVFGTSRFQTDREISQAFVLIPQSYGYGITFFQNLLNVSTGVGLRRSQIPNLIVNSIAELRDSVLTTVLAMQTFVGLVFNNPNASFIQAANSLAIIQLAGMNVMLQVLVRLAATFPSEKVIQDAIEPAVTMASKGIKGMTVVVNQISSALSSVAVDKNLVASAKSFSYAINDIIRLFDNIV